METISSIPATHAAGCTYRMLDYWSREKAIIPSVPADGCGSSRRWSLDDTALLRAVTVLRKLGAPLPVCAEFGRELLAQPEMMAQRVLIDADGHITKRGNGWTVDLGACRRDVIESGLFPETVAAVA